MIKIARRDRRNKINKLGAIQLVLANAESSLMQSVNKLQIKKFYFFQFTLKTMNNEDIELFSRRR